MEGINTNLDNSKIEIPDKLFFRIGEVAELAGIKQYVLRYWETEFPMITPSKSMSGQRVYSKSDVETILLIKHLLYNERYSIEGARNRIRQLRKGREIETYTRENVLGGEAELERQERWKEINKLAEEVHVLAKRPVHEIFKY